MSTSYYRLVEPFSNIKVIGNMITLRSNDRPAGIILVPPEFVIQVVRLFRPYEEDDLAPMRTHWGGKELGTVVTVNEVLADDITLISEYGEVLTVAQIKARAGVRRTDGFPTELVGVSPEVDPGFNAT